MDGQFDEEDEDDTWNSVDIDDDLTEEVRIGIHRSTYPKGIILYVHIYLAFKRPVPAFRNGVVATVEGSYLF
uniref:Autophagy_act_C domain-containing protein n=1 Tax=Ascaris lumbricoides TaxID=6252 RepID=A0A0M3HMD2_ASCLU